MIATKCNELFTNWAATIGFPLAAFCVLNHTFHLLAGRQGAVGISTLTGVHEGLDAALNAEAARISRVLSGSCSLVAAFVIQTKA